MKINPNKISIKRYPLLRGAVLAYVNQHSIDGKTYAKCEINNDVDHQYPWRSKGRFIRVYTGASYKDFFVRDYDHLLKSRKVIRASGKYTPPKGL